MWPASGHVCPRDLLRCPDVILTRLRTRLTTSPRALSPEAAAALDARLQEDRPGFRRAVRADASLTARYRGELAEFANRVELVAQVVRLCFVTDSFFAQVCYRAETACRAQRVPLVPGVLHRLSIVTGQISIGPRAVVRAGVYMPHGQVVVDGLTLVEEGVVIRPFVTLGLRDGYIFGPRIGARTMIGTGAKVFGPVTVGEDSQIGANAVVNRDVAAGTTVAGSPATAI